MELNLSEDSKKVIQEIFESKDKDKNGVIDSRELKQCLMAVGFCPTSDDLEFLLEQFDTDGNGKLEIKEIMANLDVINAHSIKGQDLMLAFEKFDLRNDGFIRQDELKTILTKCGKDRMTGYEADELISHLLDKYDDNNDGKFSYPEFVRIMMQEDMVSVHEKEDTKKLKPKNKKR